jgi:hypothetical protein
MGIDAALHINNNFFENNITYTLDKLKEITSKEILFFSEFNDYEKYSGTNWSVFIDEYNSVEECFANENYIEIARFYGTEKEENLWFTKNNIELRSNKFSVPGRWFGFRDYMINDFDIEMDGKDAFEKYNSYFNELIENVVEYGKLFKSNEIIIFCSDYNQDDRELLWDGMTIKEFISLDKWTIIKEIPYKMDYSKYDKYDTAGFIYHKEWELKEFNLIDWKNIFD